MSDNKNEHAIVALFDSVTDADIAIDRSHTLPGSRQDFQEGLFLALW